jgi:hypothetical protein
LRTADQNREKVGCKNLDFDQGDQISLWNIRPKGRPINVLVKIKT